MITKEHIKSILLGFGLKPKYYEQIIGEVVKCNIAGGTPASFDLIL